MSTNTVFTNTIAENYEKYRGPMFFEPYAKDLAKRLNSKNITSILETACGTGQVTRLLRKQLPGAKITATDLNAGMLELATKIINPEDKIEWFIADAMELPFDENTFDAVICQFGMMFVPDKQKAVNEAYRVLKPGGRFVFSTWDSIEKSIITEISRDVLNSYFKDKPADFYSVPFSMFSPEENEMLLENAGFKNASVENIKYTGDCSSAENAAIAMTEGSPAFLDICERDKTLLPAIQKTLCNEIKKVFGPSSFKIQLEALIAEGVK